MPQYLCEAAGIFRLDDQGTAGPVHLCPPIVVLGASDDPQRPAGKLIHLAWAERGDAPNWDEAHIPTHLVANSATLEAILAGSGWRPIDDRWHDFICASAIEHLSETSTLPSLAAVG